MKRALLLIACAFPTFLLLSCSSGSFVSLDSLKEQLNMKDFPSQKDYPEADAVVLSETHHVTVIITASYDIQTKEHVTKVLKLFKNIDNYAAVSIPIYSGDYLSNISARTIKERSTSQSSSAYRRINTSSAICPPIRLPGPKASTIGRTIRMRVTDD